MSSVMCVKMAPRRRAAARSRPPPLELWLWQCGSLDELHLSTSAARARAPVRWGALGGAGDIGAGGGGAAAGARRRALVYAYIDPSRVFGSLGLAVVTALALCFFSSSRIDICAPLHLSPLRALLVL